MGKCLWMKIFNNNNRPGCSRCFSWAQTCWREVPSPGQLGLAGRSVLLTVASLCLHFLILKARTAEDSSVLRTICKLGSVQKCRLWLPHGERWRWPCSLASCTSGSRRVPPRVSQEELTDRGRAVSPGKTIPRPGSLVRVQSRNLNRLFRISIKEITEQCVFCFVFLQSNLY